MVAQARQSTRVFISHSEADRDVARRVASALTGAGFEVWVDEDVLPGENGPLKAGQALAAAGAMVVLLSPEAVRSPNLAVELGYALGAAQYEGRVIPVVVRATDNVPWILERFRMIRAEDDPDAAGRKVVNRLRRLTGGRQP